jgi:EF hand
MEILMKKLLLASCLALFALATVNAYANHHEGSYESEGKEMEADVNSDGKVSYDEFKAAREKYMEEHFKRRDTNGDGFIDQAERDAAKKNWKKHHGDMKHGNMKDTEKK